MSQHFFVAMNTSLINESSVKGDLPRVAAAVLKALGGHEAMGEAMADDIHRIRHGNMPEEKRERFVLSYHRLFLNMFAKKDQYELDTTEFAGLTEQELKLMLRQSALESLKIDGDFRTQVLAVLNQENPDEVRKMLGLQVLEAEPAYTEALDESGAE